MHVVQLIHEVGTWQMMGSYWVSLKFLLPQSIVSVVDNLTKTVTFDIAVTLFSTASHMHLIFGKNKYNS